jgi:hypothetical protein
MPPLKNDLAILKREVGAVGKLLESHPIISKQQATILKKLLATLVTVLNGLNDEKVSKP